MKDKKAIRKNIIILIIIIVGSTAIWFLYPIIQLSLFYIFTPKSELQIKIENYINEYNRTCDADDKVKITYYHEIGPEKDCKFGFLDSQVHNDDSIISFFIKFHNDFGYDYLSNAEVGNKYFYEDDVAYFSFENIKMSYGERMLLPAELSIDRCDIDAALYGDRTKIYVDSETIAKFRGTVYVF